MAKKAAKKKAPTKSEIFAHIAEETELTKKQVAAVFDSLAAMIQKNLKPRGPEEFTIPGLCKLQVKVKPAKKAGEVKNPFTGEMVWKEAQPASKAVKIRTLKALNDMVNS